MRKRLSCLLLSGALALGLAACALGGEAPGPSRPVETEAPSQPHQIAPPSEALGLPPELSGPPAVELDLTELPDREYQPWQTAYMEFLTGLLRAEQGNLDAFFQHGPYFDPSEERPDGEAGYVGLAVDDRGICYMNAGRQLSMTEVMEMGSETYSLYDVDRDGVPELFVSYGGWIAQCYTYRDGQIVCIGEFDMKDSGLYSHPEKDAVLLHGGRMGYYELYEYPMEDGRLGEAREIFSEGPVDAWTEAEEIVPGAEPIPYFYTWLGIYQRNYASYAPESEYLVDDQIHASAGKALLLPICDWYDGPAVTGGDLGQARTAILAALDGEAQIYGASGDHFYGDVGWTTWEEYIQPGAAYFYNERPLETVGHAWMDMNGDGQEECLLRVVTSRGEDDGNGEPWTLEATVVLTEQDGTVYAYLFGFYEDADDFRDDGTILNFGETWKLSFWKGQCYAYYAQRDPSAGPVEWLGGAPKG